MATLTLAGLMVFFLVSSVVGVRLVLLWTRTRQLPELLIGIGVLGIGPCGFSLAVVSRALAESAPDASRLFWLVAFLAMNAGGAATYTFNWRVFQRDRAWARAAAVGATLALLIVWTLEIGAATPFEGRPSAGFEIASWLRIVCLLWAGGESLLYHKRMRRRLPLGLADPVVCNRFLLWGIGIGAAGVGSLIGTVATMLTDSAHPPAWINLSSSLHGLAAAIGMWLAFLPPGWYLAWLAKAKPAPQTTDA